MESNQSEAATHPADQRQCVKPRHANIWCHQSIASIDNNFLLQHSAQLKKIFKAFELTLPEAQRLAQRGKTGELALAVIFGVKGSHFDPVSAVRFDGK